MINTKRNRKALKNFSIWHANISFPVTACKCYCCSNFLLFEMYHDGFTVSQLPFLYVGFILQKSGFGIRMGICIICGRYVNVFSNILYHDADVPTCNFRFSQWWILRWLFSRIWRNLLPPYSECKITPESIDTCWLRVWLQCSQRLCQSMQGLNLYPEDEGSTFLSNLPDYMESWLRRQ
jgi:hypothetical protein